MGQTYILKYRYMSFELNKILQFIQNLSFRLKSIVMKIDTEGDETNSWNTEHDMRKWDGQTYAKLAR